MLCVVGLLQNKGDSLAYHVEGLANELSAGNGELREVQERKLETRGVCEPEIVVCRKK